MGGQPLFAATFQEDGLPDRLRTDNGVPFAGRGVGGLSRLSVWWLRLGIVPERITPGTPSENGRHARLHRTLKAEACRQPGTTLLEQQRLLSAFRTEYTTVRPHAALGQVTPASVQTPRARPYPARLPEVS
jgi:putative transposase